MLGLAWGLMSGSGELSVPASAAAAACDDEALIGLREIVEALAGSVVVENCSYRNFKDDAFAFAAGALGAFAVAPALAFVLGIEAEMDESVVALARFHDDVPAVATIAAAGAAARDEFFAAEGDASVAAVAGFDADFGFVNKHENLFAHFLIGSVAH